MAKIFSIALFVTVFTSSVLATEVTTEVAELNKTEKPVVESEEIV